MAHTPAPDWSTIDAYLAGTLSSAERAEFEKWCRGNAGEWESLQRVERAIRVGSGVVDRDAIAAFIERVQHARMAQETPTKTPAQYPAARRLDRTSEQKGQFHSWLGFPGRRGEPTHGSFGNRTLPRSVWSLGFVVTLIAAFFVLRLGYSRAPGLTRSYTTGMYQQSIVTLDDGTRVTLAPQTTLRLVEFSQRNRTVVVDGKAFFEVPHVAGAPFEVRSGAVTTRVLGTAFLVDHVPHRALVRVAVEEGKVRVSSSLRANADITVTAGEVGEIVDSTMIVKAVVDSASGVAWSRGQLVFYDMPVATVLQTLSRWYGYRFRCVDSTLPQRSVTIGLSVRSSASALATLEQVLRVNLVMTGDTVTLTPYAERRAKGIPRVHSYDIWTPTREVGR